jgi:hypothetical protein
MATINQVQTGFAKFVDNHLAGAFSGWQKAVVVGGATLLASSIRNLIKMYGSNPIVAAMGVYNPDAGTIDIDSLYNAFVPNLGTDKIPVPIPKIGTIKMGREDIDVLVRYIKEA